MKNASVQTGFTLIEIMTALTVFMVIMTISMGSILNIFDVSRKTQSESVVMNNLNLAIESMSREMRFGSNYHCGASGTLTEANSCSEGDTLVAFRSPDGLETMVYKYDPDSKAILRSTDGGSSYVAVTAPEIDIENLTFYVLGAEAPPLNTLQPKVLVSLKGFSGTKTNTRTEFSLQTLVSQRRLDNGR